MTDIASLQDRLEKARAEAEKLAQQLADARARQLTELPRQVGLETVDELIGALTEHASPRLKAKLRQAIPAKADAKESARTGRTETAPRRRRTAITPELRQRVVEALKDGKMTGAKIAKEFGISLPSVQNIKKAAGLVRASK